MSREGPFVGGLKRVGRIQECLMIRRGTRFKWQDTGSFDQQRFTCPRTACASDRRTPARQPTRVDLYVFYIIVHVENDVVSAVARAEPDCRSDRKQSFHGFRAPSVTRIFTICQVDRNSKLICNRRFAFHTLQTLVATYILMALGPTAK